MQILLCYVKARSLLRKFARVLSFPKMTLSELRGIRHAYGVHGVNDQCAIASTSPSLECPLPDPDLETTLQ